MSQTGDLERRKPLVSACNVRKLRRPARMSEVLSWYCRYCTQCTV